MRTESAIVGISDTKLPLSLLNSFLLTNNGKKKQETCRDENGIDDDVEDDTAEYGDYFILMELVQLYSRLTFKLFNFCFFCSVMIYAPC